MLGVNVFLPNAFGLWLIMEIELTDKELRNHLTLTAKEVLEYA